MGRRALAVLTAIAAVALAACTSFAAPRATAVYIDVSESGNATVKIVYQDSASGNFSTYLPRFERWSHSVRSGGVVAIAVTNSSAYFYDIVTFTYTPGPGEGFAIAINYSFPFAALYAGNRGWFMSPLIGVSPPSSITVVITIENLGTVLSVTLNGAMTSYALEGRTLRVPVADARSAALGGLRVTVDFRPEGRIEETRMVEDAGGVRVSLEAAPFYRGLARRIAGVVAKSLPELREVFGFRPAEVGFKVFLPSMMDLSALGYVVGEDINAGGEGFVHLNLALVRFKEGFMEITIVHELVHKALGALGVPASQELRWFHEGVAQYASIKICEKLGIDVSDALSNLEQAVAIFRSGVARPSFVSPWNPAGNEAQYYAASYYIISELAQERGGLQYLQRVANEIRRRGGVKTNRELIEALSAAAGEDLAPLFSEWGFEVHAASKAPAIPRWAIVAAATIAAVAVAFSLAVILRRRERLRCPYCYAVVPKGAVLCPYCDFPLE